MAAEKKSFVEPPGDEWTTSAGVKMKISEMTDSHVTNCYRKFRGSPIGEKFKEELKRRGLFSEDFDSQQNDVLTEIIELFELYIQSAEEERLYDEKILDRLDVLKETVAKGETYVPHKTIVGSSFPSYMERKAKDGFDKSVADWDPFRF